VCEHQSYFLGRIFAVFDPKCFFGKISEFVGKNVNSTNFLLIVLEKLDIFSISQKWKKQKNIGEHNLVSFYHVCLLAAFVGSAYSEGRETMEGFSFGHTFRGTFIRREFEHLN